MPWIHRRGLMKLGTGTGVVLQGGPQIASINLDGLWRITFYIICTKPGSVIIDGVDAVSFMIVSAAGVITPVPFSTGGAPAIDGRPALMKGLIRISMIEDVMVTYEREWIEWED